MFTMLPALAQCSRSPSGGVIVEGLPSTSPQCHPNLFLAKRARSTMLGLNYELKSAVFKCCYDTAAQSDTTPLKSSPDEEPLVPTSSTNRKRKNSGSKQPTPPSSSSTMKRGREEDESPPATKCRDTQRNKKLVHLLIPNLRRAEPCEDTKPLIGDDLPSPGSKHQELLIQKWLADCPEPRTLKSPDEVISAPEYSGGSKERFVMVQVFTKDSLVKSDLIALPTEGQSSEICISHLGGKQQPHRESDHFKVFQFQIFLENPAYCEQFIRQFGDGIRMFCDENQVIHLQKSTALLTYYGTNSSDWVELRDSVSWKPVYRFPTIKPSHQGRQSGTTQNDNVGTMPNQGKNVGAIPGRDFNPPTACPENVVRISVGCEPKSYQIYQTQFHIKLSFVMR